MPTPIYPLSLLQSPHPYPLTATSWTITPAGWVAGPRYLYVTFSNDTVVFRNIESALPSNDEIIVFTDTETVTYFGNDLAGKTLKLLSTNGLITVTIQNTTGTNTSGGVGGWYGFRITDLAFDGGPLPPQYLIGSPNAFDQPEPYNAGTRFAPLNGEGPNWVLPPPNTDYPIELLPGTIGQNGVGLNYSYQLRTPPSYHMLAPVGVYSPTGGTYVAGPSDGYQVYLVTAVLSSTGYPHETLPSPIVTVVLPSTAHGGTNAGSVAVSWGAIPNAIYYNVYNINNSHPLITGNIVNQAYRVYGTSFVDNGIDSTYYPQYPPVTNLAVTYSLYGGQLPSNLTLDPAGSGAIYGIPGAAGTFYFTVKAHDLVTVTDTYGQYIIRIFNIPVLVNTSASLIESTDQCLQSDVDFNSLFHRRSAFWQFSLVFSVFGGCSPRIYKSLVDGLNLPGTAGSSWVEQARLSNTADWTSFSFYYDGADTVYGIGKKLSATLPFNQTQTAFVTAYSYSLLTNTWTTITPSYLTINAIDVSPARIVKLTSGSLRVFYIGASAPTGTAPGTLTLLQENYQISGVTVGTLVPGTQYFYVLTAIIGGAETNVSAEGSGTITPGSGNQSIDVSWPSMAGVTTFNLYRGTASGGENVVYTNIPGSATQFHDLGQYYAGAGPDTPLAGQPVSGTPPATSYSHLFSVDIVSGVFGSPAVVDTGADFIESGDNLALTSVTYQAASWNGDGAIDIAHLIYTDNAPATVGGLKYVRVYASTIISTISSFNSYHVSPTSYGIITAGNCLLLPQRNEILISMYMPDAGATYEQSVPGVMRIPLTVTGTTALGNFESSQQSQDTMAHQQWGSNTSKCIKLNRTRFGSYVLVWGGVSNLVNIFSFNNLAMSLFYSANVTDNSPSPWLNWTPFQQLYSTNWNPVTGSTSVGEAEMYHLSLEADIHNFLYVGVNGIMPWDTLSRPKDYYIPLPTGAASCTGGGSPVTPPTLACPVGGGTATVGTPYSKALVASGGTPPYTFAIISGALPAGLSLNVSTGVISGVPAASGTFSYTAQLTDSASQTATTSCGIVVSAVIPTTGPRLSLAFNTQKPGWWVDYYTPPVNLHYQDEAEDSITVLCGCMNGSIQQFSQETSGSVEQVPCQIRQGAVDFEDFRSLKQAIDLALDVTGTVQANILADSWATIVGTSSLTGTGAAPPIWPIAEAFNAASLFENLAIDLTWTGAQQVDKYDLGYLQNPMLAGAFVTNPNEMGFEGYGHVREVVLNTVAKVATTANLVIQAEFPGIITIPLTIPAGASKQFIPLPANKGMLYQWSLQGAGLDFGVYSCEIHAKGWQETGRYRVAVPFSE